MRMILLSEVLCIIKLLAVWCLKNLHKFASCYYNRLLIFIYEMMATIYNICMAASLYIKKKTIKYSLWLRKWRIIRAACSGSETFLDRFCCCVVHQHTHHASYLVAPTPHTIIILLVFTFPTTIISLFDYCI